MRCRSVVARSRDFQGGVGAQRCGRATLPHRRCYRASTPPAFPQPPARLQQPARLRCVAGRRAARCPQQGSGVFGGISPSQSEYASPLLPRIHAAGISTASGSVSIGQIRHPPRRISPSQSDRRGLFERHRQANRLGARFRKGVLFRGNPGLHPAFWLVRGPDRKISNSGRPGTNS
jgi:hypothetical protein